MKNKWYRPVLFNIVSLLHRILLCFPRGVALQLAKVLGYAGYYCVARERKKALDNLRQGYGDTKTDKEIQTIAKRVFVNLALTACDFALLPKFDKKFISDIVSIEELDLLKKIMDEQGRGVIIVTAHLGNWEYLAPAVINQGYNGPVLGRRLRYEKYNDLIVGLRKSQEVMTYYTDQSPRELISVLKRGGMIGIVPDQDIKGFDGIFVDFFGQPAYTPTGPAKFALMAKVPILMTYLLRDGKRYKLVFDSVIDTSLRDDENKDEAVHRITKAWSDNVEKYIRLYPEQWAWIHNRWKTKPPAECTN